MRLGIVAGDQGAMMRRLEGLAVVIAMAVAGGAAAEKRPSWKENWTAEPTPEEQKAAYAAILRPGVFYRAVVRCAVEDDGGLSGCKIMRDTPAGAGFAAALLSLTPKYKRKPPGARGVREVAIADEWFQYDKAPDWLRRPSPEQLLAVFPTEAYKRGQDGKAVINCTNTVQGALTDCITLEESPVGAGFGGAAIALTPQFLMKPAMYKGAPVTSTVTIPINFLLPGPGDTFGTKRVINAAIAWSEAPTFAQVAEAYPPKARREKRGGRATLACDMTAEGRLAHCDVATSDPPGYGFDRAAKALSKYFALAVTSDADRKTARTLQVHLPVTFDPTMLEATPVIGRPSWAAMPKAEQLRAAFKDVKANGARAVLSCTVTAGGLLADCVVASETPAGSGAGAAALMLAPTFRLTTWTAEGLPAIGGKVSIPIRYVVEPETPAAKP